MAILSRIIAPAAEFLSRGKTGARRVSAQRAERWLRLVSFLFFIGLIVPIGLMLQTIYSQLDNEVFFQLRTEAERLNEQVNRKLNETITTEENRPFNDYTFFNVTELPLVQQKRLAISPLAQTNPAGAPAGLVGYFQVDPSGGFSSPVIPSAALSESDIGSLGISSEELARRTEIRNQLYSMLFAGDGGSVVLAASKAAESKADSAAGGFSGFRNSIDRSAAAPALNDDIADEEGSVRAESAASQNLKNNLPAEEPIDRAEWMAGKGQQVQATAVNNLKSRMDAQLDAKAKEEFASQISSAQPEQFLNSQVGTFQGQKLSDLNIESKWAAAPAEKRSVPAQADKSLSKSINSMASRKKVQVETASPENTTRDLYANVGSVAQQDFNAPVKQQTEKGQQAESSTMGWNRFWSRPDNSDQTAAAAGTAAQGAQIEAEQISPLRYGRQRAIREADLQTMPAADELQSKPQSATAAQAPRSDSRANANEPGIKILSFEAEIEPFRSRALPEKRIVFFRNVWRENKRYIQGFVVDGPAFLRQVLDTPVAGSPLEPISNIIVSYADEVFETLRSQTQSAGTPKSGREVLIASGKLIAPLNSFGLLITTARMPEAPGRLLVDILSAALLGIVLVGQWSLYSIARKQIRLAKERSDFVSAVSHELKTPLTSIRMYAEMLREGWISDEGKKRGYYDFIFRESERLSRLINNVLDFSRLSNNPHSSIELKRFQPADLFGRARERAGAMVNSAGFKMEETVEPAAADTERFILADEDSFIRIIINLVDNAIKFSAQSEDKRVALGLRFRSSGAGEIIFSVRDFGPGIAREKMKKIFTLFYRGSDEMTRTTQGTGIGLALVKELAEKMGARIDLSNQNPGAQFEIVFSAIK